jgi:hypothetical protein
MEEDTAIIGMVMAIMSMVIMMDIGVGMAIREATTVAVADIITNYHLI